MGDLKRIVWDEPARVMQFVAEGCNEGKPFQEYSAIGLEKNGEIVGGVVYDYHTGPSIFAHIASDKTRQWMTPAYLAAIFRYPFLQLGCQRLTVFVREDNADSLQFVANLGFQKEGEIRRACIDGKSLIVLGMLRDECRFLDGKYHAALLESLRT